MGIMHLTLGPHSGAAGGTRAKHEVIIVIAAGQFFRVDESGELESLGRRWLLFLV